MVIVLVKWKIKPGLEESFLKHWQQHLTVRDDLDLVGEFLCTPKSREYATWRLPDPGDPPCAIFLNVGIWRSESAFLEQIAPYFSDDAEPLHFEANRRVRTVLSANACRIGQARLPSDNSDGVV
ncbi:MAG: hypothetical protein OXG05_13110 [Gammaproteobacteria bacterium]|nr:hypothetical protein [Gammaproteobacteria bacterium]